MINGIERIEQMVSALVVAIPSSSTQGQLPASTSSSTSNSITMPSRQSKTVAQRILAASYWRLGRSWESWGLRGSMSKTTRASYTDYTVGFTVPLPLARILGSYAFTGSLSLRSCPLAGNLFTFRHPSYFATARVLEDDHPFLQACLYGDLAVVQAMLQGGKGRPTDIDKDGNGPLWVCSKLFAEAVLFLAKECLVRHFPRQHRRSQLSSRQRHGHRPID